MDAIPQSKPAATPERLRALWPLIGELVRPRRGLLAIGFGVMVVNRLSGLVLPASTKFLIDDIIAHQRRELLVPLALAVILTEGTGHLFARNPWISLERQSDSCQA
jgi:ABC-type bacteriocin/lantibiotic exporter with double-glycine peptidase domain